MEEKVGAMVKLDCVNLTGWGATQGIGGAHFQCVWVVLCLVP